MNKIKEHRQACGLSQQELACELNVTQACVAQWERGISMPTSSKLPQLAQALHCTIDELYDTQPA